MTAVWILRSKSGLKLGQLAGTLTRRQVRGIGSRIATAIGRQVSATLESVGAVKQNARRRPARVARSTGKRRRRRPRPRRNPSPALLERAGKTFEMWHGFGPSDLERVKLGRQVPSVLVKIGELAAVEYVSNKWTGRQERYRHVLKRPRPLLCTGPDAKGVFVVGGRVKVTERGLVD